MANCLYECLREAKLEQYYQNFEANGITRSEGLTSLTMQEYSNYGIDDMYDRKRLFQLIQIIKSVQNNGKKCRRNCESCQDEGTPRLSNRSSPESESSVDDLHQAYTTSANQNDSLNNSVITRKYIKTNNNNVMSSRMPDKVDNKPEIVFVETQGPSLQKSRSQTRRHTLRRSLSDSETMEPNQDNHRPKLRDRTAEVINYAGLEYNYGVPSAAPRTAPAASSYATHVNLLNTSAMPVDRIQVCVRKRPMNKKEKRNKEADVIDVEHPRKIVLNEQKTSVDLTRFIQQHEFYFDEVFDENQSNEQIYERTAKPLVNSVFKGGKATCFAYGQTGAGKTHTMLGNDKVQGLYLLAAKDIFSILHSGYHGRNLSVWISYFEIYCGQLFDLLNGRKRLHAREDGKNNVCIAGIKEFQIGNVAALMEAIEFGNQVRSTGSSGVNADSSRSHAILQVQLKENSKRKVGRFSFIDLAGSERAADTNDPDRITRIEGAEINTSLLALKECIRAIDQEQRHTPFRQSKLTHILKESFLGNSRTCMIANISPNSNASEHTLNTLRYANRVKELKKDSVSSSSGSPNSATHLPRAPSIFSPSNTSTPKRKPKPSPLSRESTSWEVSQIRGCNYKPYSVPKLRASRDSRKTNRKYSSPEEDNRNLHIHNTVGSPRGIHNSVGSPRSIYNGVGSPRGNIGSSRISIERGEVRVVGGDSGDIKVVKYSPSKSSSDYFSTPVLTRNFSETNWEFDNPRFVSSPRRSGTTAQTSPGSPAKSEASVRLSVDNLKSDGALRKSKEFWVVRNDSSSVRNLLMDSSPEEADEGEISETDSDSTSTDNTSEIIKELDRILDQSWIKSGSSGDNSYQQAEHPDELQIDPLTDQRIFQTDQSITLRPQEDSDNMAATSTRPVCDLRAPEKPDVEENGVHEVNGYSLRDTAAANMNGYHSNDVGKVKVSKKSRKRWVADATIGNSMAREIEGLPSPRDFLKSLSQTKSAEKQKQGTPSKKTSPSGVIVPTDFQECFMPTQLKYTPEPESETVAGTQTSVSTSPVADIPSVVNPVSSTSEYISPRVHHDMPKSDENSTISSASYMDRQLENATSDRPVEVLATQPIVNSNNTVDRVPLNLAVAVPHQVPIAVNMSMPVTTTTITTITTTVSTSTFASPRKPDTDESYQPQAITASDVSPPLNSSPSKTNIIKLSPRKDNPPQESPRSDETQSHLSETAKKPEEGAVGVEVDDAESCTSGSQTSNPRCLNEEKDVSPAGSDILTPSRKSAFTLVQPRPKVPAVQNSADKVPKTRPVVTLPLKSGNAVNGSSTVQGEKNAYFAPVRKEYTLACSFPQDELRKEISQALATSSIRPQNEAFIMGLDTSQSLMNSVEIESPYRETEQTSGNRPMFMSKKNSALERAKDLMLSAHEEQIIEMGQLSEKEYKLIQEVKDGDRDFTYFVEKLDDLLYSKIRCIETLRSQLESFSQSTTPRKS